MTFAQQSKKFLEALETRKRAPISANTIRIYQSHLRAHILPSLGGVNIAVFENGAMKRFVGGLEGLAPSTVVSIANLVKAVVASCQDANGNELYPRAWNNEFIDLPIVSSRDQKAPVIGVPALERAISGAGGQFRALYALLAGTGLRISEALALRAGRPDDGRSSIWLPGESKLIIRGQVQNGEFVRPKTAAGFREVDIHADINEVLCQEDCPAGNLLFTGYNGGYLPLPTAYDAAKKDGIPGFHSLRRFRVTRLREVGAPEDLLKYWIGHSGKDISDRYSKLSQNVEIRKQWAEKAGLGFTLRVL
jgi:integrase